MTKPLWKALVGLGSVRINNKDWKLQLNNEISWFEAGISWSERVVKKKKRKIDKT